ncbi:MAG: copper amine oxidase N-terminal domain-containing protein, partial [Caldisericia bacterium]|nr:copper amine oxidase N-terminal domain-containing protein [Caldisericia bacterium]
NIAIQLDIGSTTAWVNGKAVSLTAAPEIVQSRTFVPLRFVGESMGAQIEWEASAQKITIRFFEE